MMRRNRSVRSWWCESVWIAMGILVTACAENHEVRAIETPSAPGESPAARFHVSAPALQNLVLKRVSVGPKRLAGEGRYPGTIQYRASDRACVVAQVDGVLQSLEVQLGSQVASGALLLTLTSRELARARAVYIDSVHGLEFAERQAKVEAELWEKGMTSRESSLAAQHALAEAKLERRTAAQELLSLGVSQSEIESLEANADPHGGKEPEPRLNQLELCAPLAGQVVGLQVTRGQAIRAGETLLDLADLGIVWVDARVPSRDLELLPLGTALGVVGNDGEMRGEGSIVYRGPEVDPTNQTALVRIELLNPLLRWRPGMFVTVEADLQPELAPITVPVEALVRHGNVANQAIVFVDLGQGAFEARQVVLGRIDRRFVAVASGLLAGEQVVLGDTLLLKATWLGEGGSEE